MNGVKPVDSDENRRLLKEAVSQEIKHDVKEPGYLYHIAENIEPEDVCPNPNSSLEPCKEMLSKRDLKVELLCPTQILDKERLREEEISELELKREKRMGLM